MAKKKNQILTKVPPTTLTGKALEHWDRIMPVLVADGLCNKLDVPIIESACELYARYLTGIEEDDEGKAPLKCLQMYIGIMEKYGATPKSRQVMKLAEKTEKDKESDDLLKEFRMR